MPSRRAFIRTTIVAASSLAAGIFKAVAAVTAKAATVKTPAPPAPKNAVDFLTPSDPAYPAARRVYNAAIQTKPQLIARCTTAEGVQEALRRAAEEKRPVAVKAGGHSFEGFCLNEDGLVVDVSSMRDLHLDEKTGLLTAGAGCRLEEVNQFLLAKGRFLPAGSCGSVGLAGLTLGGGYGMYSRKWGLTCDHLQSVEMVDGSGKIRHSDDEPDLLWACRGGGNGHFGVVTKMTFATRRPPAGFSSWKFRIYKLDVARATALLETWFAETAHLPREAFSAWVMNGSQVTIVVTTIGSRTDKNLVAACRKLGGFSKKTTTAGPVAIGKALSWYFGDPTPAAFKNASAGYYKGMNDVRAALPVALGQVLAVPGLIFQVNTLGGAIAEGEDSAYPHRAYPYLGERQAYWDKPAQAERCIAGVGKIGEALAAAGIDRHYANYPDLAYKDWPTAYYGAENYARLQKLKALWDPEDRIRHAQSVRLPGASVG